jgi:hypothetical protein
MDNIDFAFISEASEVLFALRESKTNGTVVGISAPILGNGVFLTAVQDIQPIDGDFLITLKGYDITGYILERNKIRLTGIRGVCPFRSVFKNPYLKELTGERFFRSASS